MVLHPKTQKLMAFRMRALPFGAIKSVHAFLRVSHSLWFLLAKDLCVLTTNYFDDFVTLSMVEEAPSVKSCVHLFFKMLGWMFAESGHKAPDFSEEFQALGAAVSARSMHCGSKSFGSTESRQTELIDTITKVLSTGTMSKTSALKLRGRLQFASANIFGRVARAEPHWPVSPLTLTMRRAPALMMKQSLPSTTLQQHVGRREAQNAYGLRQSVLVPSNRR